MIVRRCAGGVVFYANKVLIVKMIGVNGHFQRKDTRRGLPYESAVQRVKVETGIDAKMIDVAGDTMYEFSQEVDNKKFVMQ